MVKLSTASHTYRSGRGTNGTRYLTTTCVRGGGVDVCADATECQNAVSTYDAPAHELQSVKESQSGDPRSTVWSIRSCPFASAERLSTATRYAARCISAVGRFPILTVWWCRVLGVGVVDDFRCKCKNEDRTKNC